MGMIARGLDLIFGDGRNVVADTVGIFRESAENAGARETQMKDAALSQLAAEFARPRKGLFDRIIDGLNRLPRPLLAFGTIGLFVVAMVDPIWFASRMQGIQLVPEPLWWLMGAIVSFYFGARHQAKGQEFQASVAETMTRATTVASNVKALEEMAAPRTPAAPVAESGGNPALEEWRGRDGG
ncbi:holin family protein [Roseisalinus antarcticus]|uniref:Holin of 3TMs, for gene-transfer release n=1 Tax=Roseisalinus antarcticus TaxID=254357 RepID=A0A1Y5RHE1_9RHOB|nr:holin family protein [Roseisalinus antarcticus]SLN16378.1 hypothetical protein ROA7023_00279 [Roseisalinus antarcticus]